jgi:hypothetical protein
MGRSFSLFLVRATGMLLAGMLLFALFGHARAQTTDNYGLNRFPGDNYDTLPPGAGMTPPPAPTGYAPVPGSSIGPNGTYSTLNGSPSNGRAAPPQNYPAYQQPYSGYGQPQNYGVAQTYGQPQAYRAQAYDQPAYGYQPAPQQPIALPQAQVPQPQTAAARQPMPQQPAQPAQPQAPQAYGYRPLPQAASSSESYGYRPSPGGQGTQIANNGWRSAPAYSPVDYVLGPGDKLKLTIYGETDLSGEFTIDGSGYVRLPLIGQVRAAGYSAPQLEQTVGAALSQGYLKSPRVSVEVSTYRPFYVIGAVNRPGQYPYVEHMNAMNAIALAGGFMPTAVESVVFIRREGSNQEVEVPVDRTTQVYPGDVIKVHTTIFSDITNWLSPFSGVAASAATAAVIQ